MNTIPRFLLTKNLENEQFFIGELILKLKNKGENNYATI
jgi:hypothetical protein